MSARNRTKAIVLKITNFKEQDKIIFFYTKELGRVDVLGKSIRKKQAKLRSFIQFPYYSEIDFIQGKNHKILTDVVLVNNFANLRKDLKKTIVAYKISSLLQYFIKEPEKDELIWNLLLETLSFLDQEKVQSNKSFFLYYYFLWNFLSLSGYKINLKEIKLKQIYTILKLFEKQDLSVINKLDEKWQKDLKKILPNLICQKIKK